MPELSRFFGIIIRMFAELGEPHHLPHFHAYYQDEVAVTCRGDEEWGRLCETVGWTIAHLARDPGLATAAGRAARCAEIDAVMREWCSSMTGDAVVNALQGNGVPAGKVQDGGQLMADPQHVDRGVFRSWDHAVFGERPYDRFPARWSGTDLEPYLPSGAYIGEHNFDVYTELAGLDTEEIAAGMGDGLFG